MRYLTNLTEKKAKAYSKGLFKISRPNPNPEDVTLYQSSWYPHKSNGTFALELDEESLLPADTFADSTKFDLGDIEETQHWKDLIGSLSPAEFNALRNNKGKGRNSKVKDFMPTAITNNLVTKEEAQSQGYLIP